VNQDRELLELAAKAAGMEPPLFWDDGLPIYQWNPLTNDGDALRLAVKLDIFASPRFFHFRGLERFGRQDDDDCAATRRAITRAAAEIGKAMP
jgi:hypothetical protein